MPAPTITAMPMIVAVVRVSSRFNFAIFGVRTAGYLKYEENEGQKIENEKSGGFP